MGFVKAKLTQWAFTWRLAVSCLQLQLSTLREEFNPMYLPDEATPAELEEMASEQRALRMIAVGALVIEPTYHPEQPDS